jgi:hypothetical protein
MPGGRQVVPHPDDDLNMENQESRSKWDELARQLGADVPAVDEPPPPPAKTASEGQPAKPAAKPVPTPPKRPPSDWEGLVSELGLAPPEPDRPAEPEPEPPRRRPEPAPVAAAKQPRPVPPSQPAEAPSEPRRATGETVQAAAPPREPVSPPPEVKEQPQSTGNISLWHRIFGSPEEQAKKIADVARAAEDVPTEAPTGAHFEPRSAEPIAAGREWEESPTPVSRDLLAEAETVEAGEDVSREEEERPRKRRPRRRRRGRGRKGEDQAGPAAEAAEMATDLTVSAKREEEEEEEEETDELDRLEEEDAAETVPAPDDQYLEEPTLAAKSPAGKPKSSSHRSIPSWEETIGVLVDLNMQSRSQRKQSAPPSRGRSRGGRRRKKS